MSQKGRHNSSRTGAPGSDFQRGLTDRLLLTTLWEYETNGYKWVEFSKRAPYFLGVAEESRSVWDYKRERERDDRKQRFRKEKEQQPVKEAWFATIYAWDGRTDHETLQEPIASNPGNREHF
jgi:hypothetical protein